MGQTLDAKMVDTICHIYEAIARQKKWMLRVLTKQDKRIKDLSLIILEMKTSVYGK